jgi:hypothetical protein
MNRVERKFGSNSAFNHHRDRSPKFSNLDFADLSLPPSAYLSPDPLSTSASRTTGTKPRTSASNDFFVPPAGFEDSLSDSSLDADDPLMLKKRLGGAAAPSAGERRAFDVSGASKTLGRREARTSGVLEAANAAVDELDALLGNGSKKFLMQEFLRHQLGSLPSTTDGNGAPSTRRQRPVVQNDDDDDDFIRSAMEDEDDEDEDGDAENVRSRAAGYWTDGIYASSTPLRHRNSRAKRDGALPGRSWTSDMEDDVSYQAFFFLFSLGLEHRL